MTVADPEDTPISADAFAEAMAAAGHPPDQAPVVACSGGPDSMALALLVRDWAAARGLKAGAFTVDHGLRPEAGEEAETVAARLRALGLDAEALHHTGPKPRRDIQAAARAIRFRLIACRLGADGPPLLLAHHLEDQAETVLLRLTRGSGVDGLAAMAPKTERDGLTLIRPLLGFPRARLAATVRAAGVPVVDDPTNRDSGFTRVRLRAAEQVLAAEGLTPARLARTAARMARARAALDEARDAFLRDHARCEPSGFARLCQGAFDDLPEEIGLRVLSHLIRILGGRDHPPREDRLTALHRWACPRHLSAEGDKGRTLAGARILRRGGTLLICREQAGLADPIPVGGKLLWDGRFHGCVRLQGAAAGGKAESWRLGALGTGGLAAARAEAPDALAALPGPVRPTLPALWHGDRLIAVPHLAVFRSGDIAGSLAFRPVPAAWGDGFRRTLPFSSAPEGPI
jgi:tRNA(Ile)-lysidine synthase